MDADLDLDYDLLDDPDQGLDFLNNPNKRNNERMRREAIVQHNSRVLSVVVLLLAAIAIGLVGILLYVANQF